jgi:putative ABC transport system permease protein
MKTGTFLAVNLLIPKQKPMFRNFCKIAWRNIVRNRAFSVINISGLAIGMASSMLIFLWIQNELSYDRFHSNIANLYEVWGSDVYNGAIQSGVNTPDIMAPILKTDVPQIDKVSRITWEASNLFSVGDKSLKAKGSAVDSEFLEIFSFPLIRGDAKTALRDPFSVVITETLAKKLFGNDDPMGKTIRVDISENYKVSGILKDLPNNTLFDFDYLGTYAHQNMMHYVDSDWTDVSVRTFVTLRPNTSLDAANGNLKDVIPNHSGHRAKTAEFLYAVSRLRLYSNFENGKPVGGLIQRVKVFALIGLFILIIACINFMNLSTARSEKRSREVGVRKVAGATKGALIGQFLVESVALAFLAGVVAVVIVWLCLPAFNNLVGKQLSFSFGDPTVWLSVIGFILLTGILAGSYPAFFLSGFRPITALKGAFKETNKLVTPRKALVVLQFTCAIGLIICTLIVIQQLKYAENRSAGYNKNDLGYVFLEGDSYKNYQLIKNELVQSGAALSATRTSAPITQNWSSGISMKWQGQNPNDRVQINRYTADANLLKTMGMKLVEGRDIDAKDYPSDSTACLISESSAKAMGFKEPIGQIIFDDPINWHVVGVVGDFILESPYEAIKPFMVKGPKYNGGVMHIRLNPGHPTADNLATAGTIFKKYNPAYPFDFHFINQEYAQKFGDERLTGTLATIFASLAIFIACLGLFGLAASMAENRIKEIAVRKVLGASVTSITTLLSADFIKLVAIAMLITSPIAWWAMNSWLLGYNYRIQINWLTFVAAGGVAIIIALLTVSYQSIKAAVANPVNSLRSE